MRELLDTATFRAVLKAGHLICVLGDALALLECDVAREHVVALVRNLICVADIVGLEDLAAGWPWVHWVDRLFEKALLAGLGENSFTLVPRWVELEALGLSIGNIASVLELAGVDRLSVSGDLVLVALVVVSIETTVQGPWLHDQVFSVEEVALFSDVGEESAILLMDNRDLAWFLGNWPDDDGRVLILGLCLREAHESCNHKYQISNRH